MDRSKFFRLFISFLTIDYSYGYANLSPEFTEELTGFIDEYVEGVMDRMKENVTIDIEGKVALNAVLDYIDRACGEGLDNPAKLMLNPANILTCQSEEGSVEMALAGNIQTMDSLPILVQSSSSGSWMPGIEEQEVVEIVTAPQGEAFTEPLDEGMSAAALSTLVIACILVFSVCLKRGCRESEQLQQLRRQHEQRRVYQEPTARSA